MSQLDSMIFPIADALQARLTVTDQGFTGKLDRRVKLGPWDLQMTGEIRSAHFSKELVSAVVHLRKNLYLLVLSDQQGHRVRAIMFDGQAAGVSKCSLAGGSTSGFQKANDNAVKHLKYDNANQRWRAVDAFNLD